MSDQGDQKAPLGRHTEFSGTPSDIWDENGYFRPQVINRRKTAGIKIDVESKSMVVITVSGGRVLLDPDEAEDAVKALNGALEFIDAMGYRSVHGRKRSEG